MKSFLNKFFFRSNNLDYISREIRKISQSTPVDKIFDKPKFNKPKKNVQFKEFKKNE